VTHGASVIVVNRDGEDVLPALLDSLAAQSLPPLEVIVVDNGSQDFSHEVLRRRGNSVQLIALEKNVGASQARNLGTAAARGEVLVFVDNDSVADPDWLREGCAALERHPDWGAAGSRVHLHANRDVLNGCGADFNRSLHGRDHGFGRPAASWQFREDVSLYAMSNGLFVRRAAAEAVGRWDPAFFYYYEDTDFCLRLWRAGLPVGVTPLARLDHKLAASVGKASPAKAYLTERHRVRLGLKHLRASEWMLWLAHELKHRSGGARQLPLRAIPRLWAYNAAHLPSVLAFRRHDRRLQRSRQWHRLVDPSWGPRELSLHNLRPAPSGCRPRDRVEATLNGEDWRYGVHATTHVAGRGAQWIDGDAAIDLELTAAARRVTAHVFVPEAARGSAHLRLEHENRVAWRGELPLDDSGWRQPTWEADLGPGSYRLFVQGEPHLSHDNRRQLVAYSRICLC
jgi:GT2 family glycosyltransferase